MSNLSSRLITFDKGTSLDCIEDLDLEPLLYSAPVLRLKNIDFLGVGGDKGHSRLEHSLGVAELAYELGLKEDFDNHQLKYLVASALLHDIGHMPLSHVTEPFFRESIDVNHHYQTFDLLRGVLKPHGRDGEYSLDTALEECGVERDLVKEILRLRSSHPFSSILRSPINIDTIDGINRAAGFFGVDQVDKKELIEAITFDGNRFFLNLSYFDILAEFWALKDTVYNNHIDSHRIAFIEHRWVSALRQAAADNRSEIHEWKIFTDQPLCDELAKNPKSTHIIREIREEEFDIEGFSIDATELRTTNEELGSEQVKGVERGIHEVTSLESQAIVVSNQPKRRYVINSPVQTSLDSFTEDQEARLRSGKLGLSTSGLIFSKEIEPSIRVHVDRSRLNGLTLGSLEDRLGSYLPLANR